MADEKPSVDSVFCAAIEIESAEERQEYVAKACGQDSELLRQVDRLLRAHFGAGSFLASPPDGVAPFPTLDQPIIEKPGTQIGPYKLLQQIGEGGMGVVYMAEQREPVRRKVALKLIRPGLDSRQVIARFEAERQALALMDHPHIAKVLDTGTTERGQPYFVMELVHGVPITKYCDERRLTPRQRLELFVPVCLAIQHAHQKGVLHRDIKPSNVLIAQYDGKPVPKVIDFGVAKAMGAKLTESTMFTEFGSIVGTLEYMSPEQADRNQLDVDTRSDIYSLGVLIYELLTGSTPLDKQHLRGAAMLELLRIIKEEEPPRPSSRLSTTEELSSIAASRSLEPRKLSGVVRGELDWIVMKALDKDRERRYETANELAIDVQRYLVDEPVLACPPSAAYRFRKFVRRNKVALAMASVLASALLAAVLTLSVSNVLVMHERDQKAQALLDKEAALAKESAALANESAARLVAKENEALATEQAEEAKKQARLARQRYYASQMNLAVQAWEAEDAPRVLEILETQRPRFDEEDLRAFEWFALWELCHRDLRFNIPVTAGPIYRIAFSPDSKAIALGSSDGAVRLIEVKGGREVAMLRVADYATSPQVHFSADGKTLAQAAGPTDDEITLWDVDTRRMRAVLPGAGIVRSLAFAPNGGSIATGDDDGVITLWHAETGKKMTSWRGLPASVWHLAFSPDGKKLAVSGDSSDVKTVLWDLTVVPARLIHEETIHGAVAFSPDGTRVAMTNFDNFRLVDSTSWKPIPVRTSHWGTGRDLAFTPDGASLAVAVSGSCVKLIQLATGHVRTFPHFSPVHAVAVSPDGQSLASIGSDAVLKVWDLRPGIKRDLLELENVAWRMAYSPDGRLLAVGDGPVIAIFDAVTGERRCVLQGHTERVWTLAFLPDSKTLASGSADLNQQNRGEVKWWDADSGKELPAPPDYRAATISIAVAPDGQAIAVGGRHDGLALYDTATSRPRTVIPGWGFVALTYSPDGQFLISFEGSGGRVTLRDPHTGEIRLTVTRDEEELTRALDCSLDGQLLATGNNLGQVRLWNLPSGGLRAVLRGNVAKVPSVAFFPDGKTLVTGSAKGDVRLFDVSTGQERVTFRGGQFVAVSRDGGTLALSSGKQVHLLRTSTAPEALARMSELNPIDPASPLADLDFADRHLDAGQVQEVEAAYRRAQVRLEQLVQHFPALQRYRLELARSHLGRFLLLSRETQTLTPDSEQAHHMGLSIHQQLPPAEQAALARVFAELGESLRTKGRRQLSEHAFALAAELKPDDHLVLSRRVVAYAAWGQWDQAVAECRTLQKRAPLAAATLLNNLGWQLATNPDVKLRDPARAVELARNAVELAPNQGNYWNTLGTADFRARSWNEASAALQKSVELRQGGDAFDWFLLSMSHWHQGHRDEARRWYEQAIAWMEQNQSHSVELRSLRKETEDLLERKLEVNEPDSIK